MVYTKAIREYCLQNEGIVFDISKEYKNHFSMMPYKTFCKILGRLEEEGTLVRESHGAYLTAKRGHTKKNQVADYYTHDGHGLVIGYHFYNMIEITDYKDGKKEILTNLIDSKTKKVGSTTLIRMNLYSFDNEYKSIIYALELIEKKYKIIDCDIEKINRFIQIYLQDYNDLVFEEIIKERKYRYSTVCTLDRLLSDIKKANCCLRIYEEIDKDASK